MRAPAWLFRAALLTVALVSSLAFAQGNSVITGTVTDAATGKPVPDVVVTATSPALQGEEIVVTDSAGLYRLAQLPAGTYTLRLEKESYKPFSRTDINLRVDRTVRVNIQLQPEAVTGDTIVVVGRPPTVDVGSTTTGINVGKEFMNNIAFIQPNGSGVRSFESLASVAPQVIGDTYGYGFSGAQSPENLYLVDGVSTSDPAFGTNGAQFPVEFVEEANVITGGYQAEYGRATGGVLNVVTKSGSNEFHGSVWGNWTPGILTGVSPVIKNDSSSFQSQGRLWNTIDFGAEVGGPILKDRLWFFVGFAPSFNRVQTTRSLRAFKLDPTTTTASCSTPPCDYLYDEDGYIQSETIPGTTKERFTDTRAFSYIAKLTYLINSDNNLSLSVVGSPSQSTTPFSFTPLRSVGNWKGGTVDVNNTNTVSLRYQGGFLDKHLLVDASAGWFHIDNSSLPDDGSKIGAPADGTTAAGTPAVIFRRTRPWTIADFETLPSNSIADTCEPKGFNASSRPIVDVRGTSRYVMACPATGAGQTYTIGGYGFMQQASLDRIQGRASVTYLMQALGHHIWKAGLDIEHLRYDILKAYSGGFILRESTSGDSYTDFRQYGYLTGPDESVRQESIHSIPTAWGIGAYLQDSWSIMDLVTLNAGLRYETQQLFAGDGTLGMSLNNMLSPRVGLIYDFTQQGRSKLFANYSRFYESVPINIADRALTGENQYQFIRFRAPTANRQGCQPYLDVNQALNECQDPNNYAPLGDAYDISNSALVTGGGRTTVDPNLQPQSSDEIVVGGEYEVITDGRVGATYTKRYMNQVIEDMSIDEANSYFIGNPGSGLGSIFPKATRDYDAVTLYFNKAFSDGWMAQVSYTWSSLRGNYNGLFRPETGQLDPNINSDFDLLSLLPNRTGPLDADRTHFIKAYASKEFAVTGSLGFILGLTYEGRSGAPLNYFGSHVIYGADEVFVLPRGSGGRLPWRHTINAKAGVSYRITKDNVVQFTADIFNMFNFQAVTSVDETLTNGDVLPFVTNDPNPQAAACLSGNNLPQCQMTNADGIPVLPIQTPDFENITTADLNPNFKRPTGYQAPISVRFGIRFTF
ncbi:MAG: TonB-dependent receptor [Myxococcota bacterium]